MMNSATHLLPVEYERFTKLHLQTLSKSQNRIDPGDGAMGGRLQGGKHHFSCQLFLLSLWLKGEKNRLVLDRKRSDTNLLPEHQRLIASVNVL